MRGLRKQIQAQGLAAAAYKVRVQKAAELQVSVLRVPGLPEAQSVVARAAPPQRSAREGGLRHRLTAEPPKPLSVIPE